MSIHNIFVISIDGSPLTPTTSAKARKLLSSKVAKKVWSKFGTFGIRLLVPTRKAVPLFVLGGDQGTKYEGFSIVGGTENHINVKVDLPNKKKIVKKLKHRAMIRHRRRLRNCRQRKVKNQNRLLRGFLAPSQLVLLKSRLKVVEELLRMYPVATIGYEDVWFDFEEEKRKGNFTSVDTGRERFREYFYSRNIKFEEFLGTDTKPAREQFGYKKCKNKAADRFEAHNSDSLTIAVLLSVNSYIEPGPTFIVDDTYRPIRRRFSEPTYGGSVRKIRKGLLVGVNKGKFGLFIGEYLGKARYIDQKGKKQVSKFILWISTNFITKPLLAPKKVIS